MAKFKVSELFRSLQGEINVGIPSVFIRLFGCNFTCSGFGMPRGKISEERLNIDPKKYEKYDDLPLVSTGCDSYASWDPKFKKFSQTFTTEQLVEKVVQLLPDKSFNQNEHLILTGGEPLLGWQKSFPELLEILRTQYGLQYVTFETNGTQPLTDEMVEYISATPEIKFFFSISSKLTVSGEKWEQAIRPDVVAGYFNDFTNTSGAFKFVVATQEDIDDVDKAVIEYNSVGIDIPVYLMPVGGVDSVYYFNNKTVANLALERGYRYTPRLQVDLWGNQWAT